MLPPPPPRPLRERRGRTNRPFYFQEKPEAYRPEGSNPWLTESQRLMDQRQLAEALRRLLDRVAARRALQNSTENPPRRAAESCEKSRRRVSESW
jgi:hypothetical protein